MDGGTLKDQQKLKSETPLMVPAGNEGAALKAEALAGAPRYDQALGGLCSHCFFIGYPRSGHSLLGAFLDAHPNVVMAHELDALAFILAGFEQREIEYLLIENARRTAAAGRYWGPYSYAVADQWQGRFHNLNILGDKKGGATTRAILRDPANLDRLNDTFGGTAKFIHITRNPFDTIATLCRKGTADRIGPVRQDLFGTVRIFFELAETNARITKSIGPDRVVNLRYEDLVLDLEATMTTVGDFLGIDMGEDGYLDACAKLLAPTPSRSREKVDWPPMMIDLIRKKSAALDFLADYRFDR